MLEKLRQAAILTFLLNLLMALSSPNANHTDPFLNRQKTALPILTLQNFIPP